MRPGYPRNHEGPSHRLGHLLFGFREHHLGRRRLPPVFQRPDTMVGPFAWQSHRTSRLPVFGTESTPSDVFDSSTPPAGGVSPAGDRYRLAGVRVDVERPRGVAERGDRLGDVVA